MSYLFTNIYRLWKQNPWEASESLNYIWFPSLFTHILDPKKKNRLRNVENLWSAHSCLPCYLSLHFGFILATALNYFIFQRQRKVVETLKCARDLQMAALRQMPGPRGRTSTGLEHLCSFNALIKKSSVRLHRHNITDSSLRTKTQHWPHQRECAAQT